VAGLQSCTLLRELVLDSNKIRALDPHSLQGLIHLRDLRMEENGMRSLKHLSRLPSLQILRLGASCQPRTCTRSTIIM
jgi:Leucine-rich repeat (LRR) protein